MVLFRLVGLKELILIRDLEYKAFPPRLEIQPIFYPVLNEEYASQIAKEWNTRDVASGFVGYVTRFEVDDEYIAKFERKIVGARMHEELWVPAEELDEFNSHILGKIEVTQAFHSLEYIKDSLFSENGIWEKRLEIITGHTWSMTSTIECHEHCELCTAYLCSEHTHKTGTDWSEAYTAECPDDYTLYLCPPCYQWLRDELELTAVDETM